MFQNKQIKHFRIIENSLFVKYRDEEEIFLTNGKVDIKDWFRTQKEYYLKAREKTIQNSKNWKYRHQNYLNYHT